MKISEQFVPAKDLYPPVSAMSLYSKREMDIYKISVSIGASFLLIYQFVCHYFFKTTIGNKLLKIKRLSVEKEDLKLIQIFKLCLVSILKYGIVFLPGPASVILLFFLMSVVSEVLSDYIAFTLLVLAFSWLILTPLKAYRKNDKVTWVEKFTKTRVYSLTSEDK